MDGVRVIRLIEDTDWVVRREDDFLVLDLPRHKIKLRIFVPAALKISDEFVRRLMTGFPSQGNDEISFSMPDA